MKILSTPENHHTFPLAIITSKSTFANCWAWNVVTPVPSPGNETRSNHLRVLYIIGWTYWWKKWINITNETFNLLQICSTIAILKRANTPFRPFQRWVVNPSANGSEPPTPPDQPYARLICLVALDHLWVISILRWQVKSFRWIICHVFVRFLRIDAWEISPAYLFFFSKFLHFLSESIGK